MSEPQLSQLLDRIVEQAPSVGVDGEQMLAAGKGRVRRRRAVGGGMAIGALVLAGALWSGLGRADLIGTWQDRQPAGTTSAHVTGDATQDSDATTPAPVVEASLTAADGTVFTLSVDGHEITAMADGTAYPTTVTPDGGPLATLWGEGHPAFFVEGWDLPDPAMARLGGVDSEGTRVWYLPEAAAKVTLDDGAPVMVLLVPADAGAPPEAFGVAEGGDITQAFPPVTQSGWVDDPLNGLELSGDEATGQVTATRGGQLLEPLPTELPDGLWAWREANGTISIVADGEPDGTRLIPVTRARDGILHARPTSVLRQGTTTVGQRQLLALSIKDEETTLVALLIADDTVDPQRVAFVGADRAEPTLEPGGARVTVDQSGTFWALYGSADEIVVGTVDGMSLAHQTGTDTYQVVALMKGDVSGGLVAGAGVSVLSGGGSQGGSDLRPWTTTVRLVQDADLLDQVYGVDTNGDKTTDLMLADALTSGG